MSSKIKNMEKVSILFFHMLHGVVVMTIFYPSDARVKKFVINLSGKKPTLITFCYQAYLAKV